MKRFFNFSASLILACTVLFCSASACDKEKNNETPIEYRKIELTKEQQQVQACETDFAITLFKNIAKSETGDFMISPFSASLALAMTSAGAAGETFNQMAATLGFKGFTSEQIGSYYKTMCSGLLKVDNTTKLAIANAIWAQNGLPVLNEFKSHATNYYSAEAANLDFAKKSSVTTINNWANTNTNGMIPTIFDDLDPNTKMVLANALYFKGSWSSREMNSDTETFTTADGKASRQKFICDTRDMGYSEGKDYTAVRVPYGNGAFNMVVVLPNAGISLDTFIANLTPESWTEITNSFGSAEVVFSMPSFKSEYKMAEVFKNTLINMGMKLPFSTEADFSNLASVPLYISDIIQKTAIEVNEKGTEAAAVTAITMKLTSVGPGYQTEFHATRPFLYAIVEKSHNTVFFIGTKQN